MKNKVIIPKNAGQKYYKTHYGFLENLARADGKKILKQRLTEKGRGFYIIYRGIRILIDFGDHKTIGENLQFYPISFRYHFSEDRHGNLPNCFPLTPISFYNWGQYWTLEKTINYDASGDMILNKQIPGKAAKGRRTKVQRILKDRYGIDCDTTIESKVDFWEKITDSLITVCVPGARNDILDRGQFQYMAFGACTISPKLNITLPFWMKPEPWKHYIPCANDYSDLIKVIEYCRADRKECARIGHEAKLLFLATSTPTRVWNWIDRCLGGL